MQRRYTSFTSNKIPKTVGRQSIALSQMLFGMLLLGLFCGCTHTETVVYTPPQNIETLIAGDSTKVWKLAKRFNGATRMNMEGCFMSYRQSFTRYKTVSDTNGLHKNCGESVVGQWEITTDSIGHHYIKIKSDQYPSLLHQPQDYKLFKILYASQDSLQLSFVHNQFGTRRRITDLLVREDLVVEDRNFHH